MAKTITLTDDLDGTADAQHCEFLLLGKVLEIDLTDEHAEELNALCSRLAVFIMAGKMKRIRATKALVSGPLDDTPPEPPKIPTAADAPPDTP
jgi:hypothetical protein